MAQMTKMEYAFHTYATFMDQANSFHLQTLGISEADRNKIVKQKYVLQQDASMAKNTAAFEYKKTTIGKQKTFESIFRYSPSIESLPFGKIMAFAAHEINHSLRQGKDINSDKENSKTIGRIAGISSAIFALHKGFSDIDIYTIPASIGIGAAVGVASYKLAKNAFNFMDEKTAYTHDGTIEYIFSEHRSSAQQLERDVSKMKEKNPPLKMIKEALFSGYPSNEMRTMFATQGKELAAKNLMDYNVKNILQKTDYNIGARRFNILHL